MDNHEKVFSMPAEEFDKVFGPEAQVPAMATSGASGQNVGADQSVLSPAKSDALCDERPAGGSSPAPSGPPTDTPRTNEFFASCEKVTGWNHLYSKQAAFCRKLERALWVIARFPVTNLDNMDAINLKLIAKDAVLFEQEPSSQSAAGDASTKEKT